MPKENDLDGSEMKQILSHENERLGDKDGSLPQQDC